MRIGRPQDAARAAGAPTGHAAIEVHRHETPPGAAGIGRLHIGHNPVEDSGVPALRQSVAAMLPNACSVEGNTFGSIGSGLAIEAKKRYG